MMLNCRTPSDANSLLDWDFTQEAENNGNDLKWQKSIPPKESNK
jgi:hypothetical protein